ncbi:MAG TPA: 2-C-methyl-D-erythritol 4-phosphate cytidylyltransferase [Candidatus Coprenecus merdipullorum]|nr:2-C-methyl-D-erythritol 4-phosphate cytidylyltransferase [Candidatus Coprenecus merdipullorum]
MRERYVIIPAGGTGTRMGAEVPKQILPLCGKPVLRHTVELFLGLPFKVNVIISINASIRGHWLDYCRKNDFIFPCVLVSGGITRFHSVRKAMKYLPDGALVAVHDGVRPLLRKDDVAALYAEAEEYPAVVPVIPVADSMRSVEESAGQDGIPVAITHVVDRSMYRLVQTPQIFHTEVLKKAYETAYSPDFTDDASVVEKNGIPLHFCRGSRFNIKLTTPEDMAVARAVMEAGLLT